MSLVLYRALLVTSCRLISDIFINLQSRIKQQTVINKQAGTILLGMGAIFSSTCIIFFKLVKPYGLSLVHAHHRLSSNTPGDQSLKVWSKTIHKLQKYLVLVKTTHLLYTIKVLIFETAHIFLKFVNCFLSNLQGLASRCV